MKFVAVIEYLQDPARVDAIRPQHRQYLAELREQGRVAASGPFTDHSGALIIYEADSREEAERMIADDPFQTNGVFLRHALRPWNPVHVNKDLFA